jgi:hypothetical protein
LQVLQAKVALLQTHTWLIHDELEQKNLLVQNNHLFEEDDGVDSDQQIMQQKFSEIAPYSSRDRDQLHLSKKII